MCEVFVYIIGDLFDTLQRLLLLCTIFLERELSFIGLIWEWRFFIFLNKKLSKDDVLILLDLQKPLIVQYDACGSTIGTILMQDGHVIAYENKLLLKTEKSLQVYEKELLAVIHALST